MTLVFHFDGLCEPKNPGGIATYGFVAHRNGKKVHEAYGLAAEPWSKGATNNVAEYTGAIKALEWALEEGYEKEAITLTGDSQLVLKQLAGEWKVKSPVIAPLFKHARELSEQFTKLKYHWVPREENAEADALTNRAYAEHIGTMRQEKRREDESIRVSRGISLEMDVRVAAASVFRKILSASSWAGPGSRIEPRKGGTFKLTQPAIAGSVAEIVDNRFISVAEENGVRASIVLTPLSDGTRVRCDVSGLSEADVPVHEKQWQFALLALQSGLDS